MAKKELSNLLEETVSVTPWSRKLYYNAEEFWKESEGLHYAHIIYNTLSGRHRDFRPDAIFYVGKSPAAYLKKVSNDKIPENEVRDWQRFLWNQTVVPMLIVQSRTQVHVYTAYTRPQKRDSHERVTAILEATTEALELDQLLTAIEAGTIYRERPEAFYKINAVDRFLLDSLNAAAVQLSETQDGGVDNQNNLIFAHKFLTRLLFVCYLVERGMIKGEHFEDNALNKLHPKTENHEGYFLRHLFDDLSTYPKRRDALCRLFVRVKERFNGSLFSDNGVLVEKEKYNESFMDVVGIFLHGHNLKNSQLMLGFWAYDFSVIPIETISAIYESFLEAQGKTREALGEDNTKHTLGAYYTPLHLTELTVDIALEKANKPIHELVVLDPACGSGVFLVSLFGRMADSLRRKKNHTYGTSGRKWASDLQKLLNNLYGIDVNPTACHITCFSLYLALLEYLLPNDVEYLRELNGNKKALRPLLAPHQDGYNVIYNDNMFNPSLALKKRDFDLIIGNPPWVSRQNQKDKYFMEWQSKDHSVYGPGYQIAHGFMWKTPEFLSHNGIACLLLPSSVLFNNSTNNFQKEWFSHVTVQKVTNFSDLRFVLFEDANHPCTAIRFKPTEAGPNTRIYYETPKIDERSQQGGAVYVREEDITILYVKDILLAAKNKEAPALWKTHFWGTWRDQRLIDRMKTYSRLNCYVGKPKENKRFIKGQGFQPFNPKPTSDIEKIRRKKEPEKPWWSPITLYLPAENITDLIVTKSSCKKVGEQFKLILFPREPELFKGPKVLISQGSQDIKVAFCGFTVLFRDSLQSITGKNKDSDLLRFLSAVVKSDVAQYFLFHTSANWGIERDKVHFHELLSLPFFLPEDSIDSQKAQEIVNEIAHTVRDIERKVEQGIFATNDDTYKIRKHIFEPLIREYYDIDEYEAMLIEDTRNYAMKSFHKRHSSDNIPTLKITEQKDQIIYAQTLCKMLNNFGENKKFKVNSELISGNPYSVVQISLADKICRNIPVINAKNKVVKVFEKLASLLNSQQGRFVYYQNLKIFDGKNLYILKPMQMRFWTRTAALNDADEIAGAILNAKGRMHDSILQH